MREILTVEHIAPYLPHGLQMINTKSGRVIDVRGLRNTVSVFIIEATVKDGNLFKDVEYQSDLWPLKPLLIPLDKITEFNKAKMFAGDQSHISNFLFDGDKFSLPLLDKLSYNGAIYLFSLHFDIFNLIQKGLAIDKTLTLPVSRD